MAEKQYESMNPVFIALGANLGKPQATFAAALASLTRAGVRVEATSDLWTSPAWPPGSDAPDYTNAVARVATHLAPQDLLDLLLHVEATHGRTRSAPNASRTLDLDLLAYGGRVVNTPRLTLPHPRMSARAFVLLPLWQIAPDWVHPVTEQGIDTLVGALPSVDGLACLRPPEANGGSHTP